ncbi:MAG: hypothetical protein HY062_01665 [Bacteroidetes bacterium]|nr:hypothetical protein [Bacteroidota bacterium]
MATEIVNNGASLKIVIDAVPRFILKSQIKDVNVLRDAIIKIDIGQGTLNNVYVDQVEVTNPASASVDELRDKIMAMLNGNNEGFATELKQDSEIATIQDLKVQVSDLQSKVSSLDNKLFFEPILVDENNPNTVYKGYAIPGSKTDAAVWAIEKVTSKNGILSHKWAGGNKSFDKVWDNRPALIYS